MANDKELIGISDAARLVNRSPATLRRWEDAGRIKPVARVNGQRVYDAAAVRRLAKGVPNA